MGDQVLGDQADDGQAAAARAAGDEHASGAGARPQELADALVALLAWAHEVDGRRRGDPVVRALRDHLGERAEAGAVVTRQLPAFELVNVQTALDAWSLADGRRVHVLGYTVPPHFGAVELPHLLHGEGLPPLRIGAPDLVDLPSGPGGLTTACWRTVLLLVDDYRGRYVLHVRGPQRHEEPSVLLEVAGLAPASAQEVLAEVDELRRRLNVYRGQVVELAPQREGVGVVFPDLPPTSRDDVVLPEAVLRRVERHVLDVAARRDVLRGAGQHLKRGVLLFGPPGTGKTHTTRYLVQQLPGTTVLMLSGRSLHMVGEVARMARELQPAAVVLEDVDLVAEERTFGPGPSPVLFELLDGMDGAAGDADLLFLLTTNRADLLEAALASRPGRVDVAVEIGLPDDDGRRRLLALYGREVLAGVSEEALDEAVRRTEGVTASFVKELVRRAVLESDDVRGGVDDGALRRALDDLLDSAQAVTRALLGGARGPDGSIPAPGLRGPQPELAPDGWSAMPGVYSD